MSTQTSPAQSGSLQVKPCQDVDPWVSLKVLSKHSFALHHAHDFTSTLASPLKPIGLRRYHLGVLLPIVNGLSCLFYLPFLALGLVQGVP